MNVVVDTNTLFSALMGPFGYPGRIYRAWLDGVFDLVTCEEQISELRIASRAPKFAGVLRPDRVGFTINLTRKSSMFFNVPRRYSAVDPTDSFLLDLAAAADAHYIITGDKKSGLLQLGKLRNTRILTPAKFCTDVLGLKI